MGSKIFYSRWLQLSSNMHPCSALQLVDVMFICLLAKFARTSHDLLWAVLRHTEPISNTESTRSLILSNEGNAFPWTRWLVLWMWTCMYMYTQTCLF